MRALALFAAAPLLLATGELAATPKAPAAGAPKLSPPACGAQIVPLVQGNTWSYEAVVSRVPILPELAKLAPRQAKSIVVTVKWVGPKGTDPVANLEEKVTYE